MENDKDNLELKHDEVPGYRKIFYVVFAVGVIYLSITFFF